MTRDEAYRMIEDLKKTFDIVRLVDPEKTIQYSIDSNGEINAESGKCFQVWKKNSRCDNCISSKVIDNKTQMTKFEFVDNEMYFVASKYVEIEGQPYVLEMVSRIKDDSFLENFGKEELSKKFPFPGGI